MYRIKIILSICKVKEPVLGQEVINLFVIKLYLYLLLETFFTQFVSDLRQVSGFLRVLQFPPPIKLTATI